MANLLKVAKIHSIQTLHDQGWSQRRIAAALKVDRETVARYVVRARAPADSKPATVANAPTGSGPPEAANGAPGGVADVNAPIEAEGASVAGEAPPERAAGPVDSRTGPPSESEAYREAILAKLEQGLSAVRIHQDLVAAHGEAAPSYYSVRRYVKRLQGRSPDPWRRLESPPGVEAQVDFGKGAMIVDASGRRRRTHVLRVVLSHSRKGYSEAVQRQTTEQFIRCLENAFCHFGGVPQTLVLDNLRAAVSKADWFDPELNPKAQSFFAHYNVVPLPTKPRTPRHKGKIERGVGYVQDNALKGHTFASLAEQNAHLRHWEEQVADTRIHGTTRRQVRQQFEQVEKPTLGPLPSTRFPCFEEGRRTVHSDGHVAVDKAYYSAPPEFLGRDVWVRYDSRIVRIFDARMNLIATHTRQEPGGFSTLDPHILDRKIAGVERGAAWLLGKVAAIGPHAQRWGEAMVRHRGIEGVRVLQGLLSLSNRHPLQQVERACEIAAEHQCYRLRTIRTLIRRDLDHADQQQRLPGLIEEHPIIRPLDDYARLVHDAFLQPTSMETHA